MNTVNRLFECLKKKKAQPSTVQKKSGDSIIDGFQAMMIKEREARLAKEKMESFRVSPNKTYYLGAPYLQEDGGISRGVSCVDHDYRTAQNGATAAMLWDWPMQKQKGLMVSKVYKVVGKRSGNEKFWWAIHNLFAHPLSEVFRLIGLRRAAVLIHDETVPKHYELKGK